MEETKIRYALLDPERSMQIYMHGINSIEEGTIENMYKAIKYYSWRGYLFESNSTKR